MKTIQYIKMESHRTIEDIAYLIEQANKRGENKPIVFLGAGASVSAGIPLVGNIIDDILELHKDKPSIKRLPEEHKKDYYKLMSALSAQERRSLFSDYINNDKVKLNVTHIYLAQMLKEKLIDYVLTVNFDDLMLKACAMFNFIPPVYDVSILNDFTTTTFLEKSVTYLHGQHHGQWLLNAEGELTKVKESIPKIFERICNNRTWIVVGYSGEDELVNEIARIGSFENELYWVGYNESPLSEQVKEKLFSNSRTNAYHIKGYDSDSFFLKLHSELNLKTPEIFNKPFSFLNKMMDQVTDIKVDEKNEHKSLFEKIKNRMEISRKLVEDAIENIENKDDENELIQSIIEKVVKQDFSENIVREFEEKIEMNNYNKAKKVLGYYYNDWGGDLFERAKEKSDKKLYMDSFEKYSIAVDLIPEESNPLFSWALALTDLARIEGDDALYIEAIEKFEKASELDAEDGSIFDNWGIALSDLALIRKDYQIFNSSFEKFKKASELNPQDEVIFYNWGTALLNLGRISHDEKAYIEGIEKYQTVTSLNPQNKIVYNNFGTALFDLARLKSDKELYLQSFSKYEIAANYNPDSSDVYNNWAVALSQLAIMENSEEIFNSSFEKFKKASELNNNNDTSLYENWGIALSHLADIKSDKELFIESIKKYQKVIELNPNNKSVYNSWGTALLNMSYLDGINKQEVLQKAKSICEKGYSLSQNPYNLACTYALIGDRENALKYLHESLEKGFITVNHVENDRDWTNYKSDLDFIDLLNSYIAP